MQTFTCSTCGKTWPANYCPDCGKTIDRAGLPQGVPEPSSTPPTSGAPPVWPPPMPPGGVERLRQPTVVTLYRIWCGLIVAVLLAFGVVESLTLAGKIEPSLGLLDEMASKENTDVRARLIEEKRKESVGGIVVAVLGVGLFGIGMLIPRAPWGWVFGIVAISASLLPACLTIAAALPLLIFWCKPDTKQYFRR